MDVWSRVLVWHTTLELRRANHRRRALLRRELAAYTLDELDDLEAAVDRCPPGRTGELRALLVDQRLRAWSRSPFAA